MAHGNKLDLDSVQAPGAKWGGLSIGLLVVGVAASIGGIAMGDKAQGLHSYLTSYMYFLSIALGGLFFVMLQHLTRAGWSVVIRRLAEGFMKNLILMLFLFAPIFLNINTIFAWADTNNPAPAKTSGDLAHAGGNYELKTGRIKGVEDEKLKYHLVDVLGKKQSYLSEGFFKIRIGVYFLIWIGLALFMFKNSVAQDSHGEAATTIKMGKFSAGAMPFFALSLTFMAFDCMMSLDYAWFSTIFGVIYFASGFVGLMASLILASFILQKKGYMKNVTIEHYHDMGKFMFAFIIFWAYVSFSQFILIRYPNIPEETIWYLHRWEQEGGVTGWKNWSIAIPVIHFILPFILLMSRHVKRNKVTCTIMACWMLVASYIHFYWVIMPTLKFPFMNTPSFSFQDIVIVVGMGLAFVGGFLFNLKNVNLIPVKDPRLEESLNFTNY